MAIRAFSIHAHFYQPPREDPLTGVIPIEQGASPFSNWNERIHAECYRANAELRNFERISFNIGPTLFGWMQAYDPETYFKIIEQDRHNVQSYGVGNALAQAYNHTILPLSNYHDKVTQVTWGIADFRHRFGHHPEGMWLPETAVDIETLEILSQLGITFTILAPWQAEAKAEIDCTKPYSIDLPNKRKIDVFFYQKDLSTRVSFDPGVTINADSFANQWLQPYLQQAKLQDSEPQIILLASDGELYGHHQHLRDHFLARLVDGACHAIGMQPTYPALWLKQYPAQFEISILENTSWSCHHGISRWIGACSCTPGDSNWKIHLRHTFNSLAESLDQIYLDIAQPLIENPWLLRDRYIHVILGEISFDSLVAEMERRSLTDSQIKRLHLILEAQRERQRMFTSCGWFFEDFDRIEPRNNVAYAAQAVRLARMASGVDLEPSVVSNLASVSSPNTGLRADHLFQRHLRRAEGFNSIHIGYAD